MPVSGITFVGSRRGPDHAHPPNASSTRRTIMNIERIARNAGFALAAAAIVFALGFAIEHQPVINALAH
jgi:hypothetical protein